MQRFLNFVKEHFLSFLMWSSIICGFTVGGILRMSTSKPWTDRQVVYMGFVGNIFQRMLAVLVIPIVLTSFVVSMSTINFVQSKKMIVWSFVLYLATTISAVVLGTILVFITGPGSVDPSHKILQASTEEFKNIDVALDIVRMVFTQNIFQSMVYKSRTVIDSTQSGDMNATDLLQEDKPLKTSLYITTNLLGLSTFCIALGVAISQMGQRKKVVVDFFHTINQALMIMTRWVLWIAPIGVFFLTMSTVATGDNLILFKTFTLYVTTVILGLVIHGFGVLPLIFYALTKTLPYKYILRMSHALAIAFGTSSSLVAVPTTIEAMDRIGVEPRISRFVIPLGATINMDGTAMYKIIAGITIAQLTKTPLTFISVISACFAAVIGSFGTLSGHFTLLMVLNALEIPTKEVMLVLSVDWILDRCRTTVNMLGDGLLAILVDRMIRGEMCAPGVDGCFEKSHTDRVELVEVVDNEP